MADQTQSTLDLEKPENRRPVEWEWWAERVGWFVIAVTLLTALLGGLGPGLLSQQEVASGDGRLFAEHYAIQRYSAPGELQITFEPPNRDAELVHLAFSQSFVDKLKIDSITPRPAAVVLAGDRVVYSFRVDDLDEQGHVLYRYEHESFGPLTGTITLLPDSKVELSQFICP